MRKRNENVVYHLQGIDSPVTREAVAHYPEVMVFFVAEDGLVVPITPDVDIKTLTKRLDGLYMYKEQLITLLFS